MCLIRDKFLVSGLNRLKYPRGFFVKCDLCKVKLIADNIGYISAAKGRRIRECKKCHRKVLRTDGGMKMLKAKKLNRSWMLVG
jgi:hypothetical protein